MNKIEKQKHIALVAHDNKKQDLIDWVLMNKAELSGHFLCGTGTTARMLAEQANLPVKAFKSGPMGGDQQIGSCISEGNIDSLIFFWDPLTSQPHDTDVKALLRIAVLYNIPVAMNRSTADFLMTSSLFSNEYEKKPDNYSLVNV